MYVHACQSYIHIALRFLTLLFNCNLEMKSAAFVLIYVLCDVRTPVCSVMSVAKLSTDTRHMHIQSVLTSTENVHFKMH